MMGPINVDRLKIIEVKSKIKNSLTRHGNGHDHDVEEEEDEYDEQDPEEHGAPYESSAVRGGVTGKPESLSHTGETNVPAPEEIVPPGTKVFPVVSSEHTKPIEPVSLQDTSYGHEALSAPGGGSDYLSGEAGVPEIAESLSRMKVTDESPDQKSRQGFGEDLPTRSQEFGLKNESDISKDSPARLGGESRAGLGEDFQRRSDDVKAETGLGRDLPTGTHDQFSPELSRPKERDDFEETRDETKQERKPSTYTEQLASATSAITNKAIAAKNVVASKL
ncbi:predicted protein, partial [Arabidopsis lyrata subsp. lyrata]